ncbi:MAG TPA: NTP transferase domain-containing protein [Candidatus Bathyarchaeia archaeon]
MKVPALIMAGGRGRRLGVPVEKPLLPFLGKPLIDWVVKAVSSAKKISEFFVVTSENTPETEKRCISNGWRFMRTNAMGYHIDLRQAVREVGLSGPILTLPSDVPAVSGKFLDKVISAFEVCGKDFLAVFVPIEKRKALGLSISSTDEYNGKWYAVSGVNIVNGSKIQIEGKIETAALITEEMEVLLNINTPEDLKVSEKIMERLKG